MTYEHLLRSYLAGGSSINSAPIADRQEEVVDKELALNKINRANIRTIGAILSNRSRDRDRFKFKPINKVK